VKKRILLIAAAISIVAGIAAAQRTAPSQILDQYGS
jgi:hypothetical protein